MHDLMVERLHFGDGNLPARRCGLLQHGPRGGAAAAHRLEEMAHAARPVCVLVAEPGLIPGRLPDLHVVPVGFQLVGDNHRQTCAHALSHLLAVAGDRNGPVFRDGDEDEWVIHPAVRHRIGAVFRFVGGECEPRQADGKHQARRRDCAEERAPADVDDFHHFSPPWVDAACLIAARIRVYVPQRQRLPLIAASMSASVGCGFCLSNAVAAMICPEWQ